MQQTRRSLSGLLVAVGLLLLFGGAASAKSIHIFVIGASNANGKGVSSSKAWPAVLESLLRKKGYDAHVTVNATNGLSSSQIIASTETIPAGTQIVIFDTGSANDRKRDMSPEQRRANQADIVRGIRAHGAIAIKAPYGNPRGRGGYPKQSDGIHFTPAGHHMIAVKLVPRVIAASHRK